MDGWLGLDCFADLDACVERSWRRSRVRNERGVGEEREREREAWGALVAFGVA